MVETFFISRIWLMNFCLKNIGLPIHNYRTMILKSQGESALFPSIKIERVK
jgi:hypothetical protein